MNRSRNLFLFVCIILLTTLACGPSAATPTTEPEEEIPPTPTNTIVPQGEPPTLTSPPGEEPSQPPPPDSTATTETILPTATTASLPTATSVPTDTPCEPDSEFMADITIEDGTLMSPGSTQTKTWRLRNDGTCTWNSNYTWEQINASGNALTGPTISIPGNVPPGGTIEISVPVTLSGSANLGDRFLARYQMRSPSGELFGTRPWALVFASNGTGVCTPPLNGQNHYINQSHGYCFVYDDQYTLNIDGNHVWVNYIPTGQGQPLGSIVGIDLIANTIGKTLQQWSGEMIAAWQDPNNPATTTNITVGGVAAIQTDDIPGMTAHRNVFLIRSNSGFHIIVMPVDPGLPDQSATEIALEIWELFQDSFAWFVP